MFAAPSTAPQVVLRSHNYSADRINPRLSLPSFSNAGVFCCVLFSGRAPCKGSTPWCPNGYENKRTEARLGTIRINHHGPGRCGGSATAGEHDGISGLQRVDGGLDSLVEAMEWVRVNRVLDVAVPGNV